VIRIAFVAAVGLVALMVALLVLLVVRRFHLARIERRQAELEERAVPLALELVSGEPEAERIQALSRAEAAALATVLQRYARLLSGEDRERIAQYFEDSGLVADEVEALGARQSWRRALAAYVLGDIGSPAAVPALLESLSDRNEDVRAAAVRSLGKLSAAEAVTPIIRLIAAGEVPTSTGGLALLEIGAAALPDLLEIIEHGTEREQVPALNLLVALEDAAQEPVLIRCLFHPSRPVRAVAARGLGHFGAAYAAAELRLALDDDSSAVRAAAASSLGRIRDQDSLVQLLRQARELDFSAARSAARAAGLISPARVIEEGGREGAPPHLAEVADYLSARLAW
jgi:HEAT repeat protein